MERRRGECAVAARTACLGAARGDVVALWDVRLPGDKGPAAAIKAGVGGSGVSWLHLDEGSGMAGQLLIAPAAAGAPIQLYDIRRLPMARAATAVLATATLPLPTKTGRMGTEGVR